MRTTTLTLTLAALLAITACQPFGSSSSSSPTAAPLSSKDVERTIDDKFPQQLTGLSVGPARCPDKLDPTDQKPATCSMSVEGQQVKISVVRNGTKNFTVSLAQAVVSLSDLEVSIEHRLRQQYTVSCGSAAVRVLDPPGSVTCTATNGKRTVQLDVTIQNTDGAYSFQEHQS